jgi:hypothetical protein
MRVTLHLSPCVRGFVCVVGVGVGMWVLVTWGLQVLAPGGLPSADTVSALLGHRPVTTLLACLRKDTAVAASAAGALSAACVQGTPASAEAGAAVAP